MTGAEIGVLVGWVVGGGAGLFALDRLLLWFESRGWIYYRHNKPGPGTIIYHTLEMSSVFNPSFKVVQEIQLREEQQDTEDGDPVGPRETTEEQA
jgi:hypothetical protein